MGWGRERAASDMTLGRGRGTEGNRVTRCPLLEMRLSCTCAYMGPKGDKRKEKGAQSAPQKRVKGETKRDLGRPKRWREEGESKNMMHVESHIWRQEGP